MKITAIARIENKTSDWTHTTREGKKISGKTTCEEIQQITFQMKETTTDDCQGPLPNLLELIDQQLDNDFYSLKADDHLKSIKSSIELIKSIVELYQEDKPASERILEIKEFIHLQRFSPIATFKSKYGAVISKINVPSLPRFVYVTILVKTDEFGCCCASPGSYRKETPIQLSTKKPDHSDQFESWDQCHVYKKNRYDDAYNFKEVIH